MENFDLKKYLAENKLLKENKSSLPINEGTFDYMKDSEEVRDLFRTITGESGYDVLDSNMFSGGGSDFSGEGEGWMLNIDDTNIPPADKAKFVDAVMKLGKQKGWKIKQYGNDSVEIYEKGFGLNEIDSMIAFTENRKIVEAFDKLMSHINSAQQKNKLSPNAMKALEVAKEEIDKLPK